MSGQVTDVIQPGTRLGSMTGCLGGGEGSFERRLTLHRSRGVKAHREHIPRVDVRAAGPDAIDEHTAQ